MEIACLASHDGDTDTHPEDLGSSGTARPCDFPAMGNVRVKDDVAEYLFNKYGIVQ